MCSLLVVRSMLLTKALHSPGRTPFEPALLCRLVRAFEGRASSPWSAVREPAIDSHLACSSVRCFVSSAWHGEFCAALSGRQWRAAVGFLLALLPRKRLRICTASRGGRDVEYPSLLRFGGFELDPANFQLRRGERPLRLERIPMEVLLLLVERQGQLVLRQEIVERIWGSDVELDVDNALNTAIRKLRHALRDDPAQARYIETVSSKGYRFIAAVTSLPRPAVAAPRRMFPPRRDAQPHEPADARRRR